VAGRRWHWPAADLEQLAATVPALGFQLVEPELQAIARWTAQGLTAYDAAYVAVAELAGLVLITDDRGIQAQAPTIAVALAHEPSASVDIPEPLPLDPGDEPPSSVLRRLRKDER